MTNVVRHARAGRCTVRLRLTTPESAELEVIDDGSGIDTRARPGVGLSSMRERASELGGRCLVEPAPNGGTRVVAVLPLGPA